MIALRNVSFIVSIAILSLSAVLVTEAQSDTATSTETATTSTSTEATDATEQTEQSEQIVAPEMSQGTRVMLQTRAQERITKLVANISNRFDATITRFSNISTRLEQRITKLSSDGMDTSAALTELRNAQTYIDEARVMMAEIDVTVYNVVTSESPRTAWPTVRTNLQEVHTKLITTQESLRTVVAVLKNAPSQTEVVTSTSTDETIVEDDNNETDAIETSN